MTTEYWRYYGLQYDPFTLINGEKDIYFPSTWEQYLDLLHYFCRSNNVLLTITGVVGSGKTIFLKQFMRQLSASAESIQWIGFEAFDANYLCTTLGKDFSLPPVIGETLEEKLEAHITSTLLENTFGFRLPPAMKVEFDTLVEKQSTQLGQTEAAERLNDFFCEEYIENTSPFELTTINFEKEFVNTEQERITCTAHVKYHQETREIKGTGNGTLGALANAFKTHYSIELEVLDYLQHVLAHGFHSLAASYIQLADKKGKIYWGVGIDSDCTLSAVRALLSALNRSQR